MMNIKDLKSLEPMGAHEIIDGIAVQMATMDTEEFIHLPNFHTWSEESRGAGRMGKKAYDHLNTFSPTQLMVAIAVYPDGTVERLDGNTRSYVIKRDHMKGVNKTLFVTMYQVTNQEQARELFKAYDSKSAVDRTNDILAYAYKELGMRPQTAVIAMGATNSIRVAYKMVTGKTFPSKGNFARCIETVRHGIDELDSLGVGLRMDITFKLKLKGGAIAAYIAVCQDQPRHGRHYVQKFLTSRASEGLLTSAAQEHGGTATNNLAAKVYDYIKSQMIDAGDWVEPQNN